MDLHFNLFVMPVVVIGVVYIVRKLGSRFRVLLRWHAMDVSRTIARVIAFSIGRTFKIAFDAFRIRIKSIEIFVVG